MTPDSPRRGRRGWQRTTRPQPAGRTAWLAAFGGPHREGRDRVLVVADEPLCTTLTRSGQEAGYEVVVCHDAAQVEQALRESSRIGYAIIATSVAWAFDLRGALATDHPEIKRVLLVQ